MNPFKKIAGILLFVSLIAISCSDDPVSSSDRGNQLPDSVPTGEIVPVEERNFVLTGFEELSGKSNAENDGGQRWWRHVVTKVEYQNCPSDLQDQEVELDNVYFGFAPNGRTYQRNGPTGSPSDIWGWEWTDSSKSAVHIQGNTDIDFVITSLNNDEVVYASVQELGQGCTGTTWEQFGSPFTESN